MTHPTEDQLRARELIALYEGVDRVTCEMVGNSYMVQTDAEVYYAISPSGNTILRSTGWLTDTTELTERLVNPAAFESATDEEREYWRRLPTDHWPRRFTPKPPTDLDSDRADELRAMGLADDEDAAYWKSLGRAV